jgi:hypothetical protein
MNEGDRRWEKEKGAIQIKTANGIAKLCARLYLFRYERVIEYRETWNCLIMNSPCTKQDEIDS